MYRPIASTLPRISQHELPAKAGKLAAILGVTALLLRLPTPLNVAAILGPAAALLVFAHPLLLPFGLVASVPLQDALPIPAGIPLTGTRAAVLAAVGLAPLIVMSRSLPVRLPRFVIAIVLLMAVFVVSLWNANTFMAGYAELYHWLVALLAFWLVIQFVRTRRAALAFLALVAALSIGQALYGVTQSVLGIGPASFDIGMGFLRAYGTFGMPNSYAAYMETVTIPLIPAALWSASKSWRLLSEYRIQRIKGFQATQDLRRRLATSAGLTFVLAGGAGAGLLALALSFSRGGWVGIGVAIAVMLVLMGRRVLFTTIGFTAIAAVLLLLVGGGAVAEVIEERVTETIDEATLGDVRRISVTSENFAVVERLAHWQTAIAMWREHQWLGVGVGNFNERFNEFAVHPNFDESQGHAHNYYLHLLAETGLAGLLAYLFVLIAAMDLGWRAYKSSDPLARAIGVGAVGMTVMLATHNLFEKLHVLNISVQIFAVWALAAVALEWSEDAQSTWDQRPAVDDAGGRSSGTGVTL